MNNKLLTGLRTTKIEISVYFFVWITAIIYSIYKFSLSCADFFQDHIDEYGDFEEGVPFLSAKRDKADFEWESVLYFLNFIYPWGILHLFITEFITNVISL
ncbi:unnamed protein product [Acanthoscelides obtectus]|uniref:Uncharacterized protein n=1 Tax=Acanthoscelides obtectus TaxID=200917 RepID=A0A9P0PZU4_ACAOB|nr:unnamed protein product [Acanthoscelides obtectus]CAK1657815.1 hypothetical protein AOBTE_LOCUS20548 [Acanthoscelides obtectus]